FGHQLADRLAALPGVQGAAITSKLPLLLDGHNGSGIWVEDYPLAPDAVPSVHSIANVTEDYFHVMGIPIIAGRTFTRGDDANFVHAADARCRRWRRTAPRLGRDLRRDRVHGELADARDRRSHGPRRAAWPGARDGDSPGTHTGRGRRGDRTCRRAGADAVPD